MRGRSSGGSNGGSFTGSLYGCGSGCGLLFGSAGFGVGGTIGSLVMIGNSWRCGKFRLDGSDRRFIHALAGN
jgi:hypothetical protein